MNVLHVNMSLDPVTGGGTVERVRQLHAAMLAMDGIKSRILSLDAGLEGNVPDANGIVLLPCWNRRWYLPAPRFLTMLREVRRADIVILMNHWTILNVVVFFMIRLCRTPYVVCPAGALPLFGRSQLFKRLYNATVGRRMVAGADAAIAIAADEATEMQQYGIASGHIHHIPNGVRIEDFAEAGDELFRRHVGLAEGQEYLLFVGRLNSIKGPDLLLQAFVSVASRFRNLHLVFVGPDGGLQSSLLQMAEEAGLSDRVHVAGYAGGDLKSSAYHGASMLVVPSRQEAMSIVALEAAVCAIPVILTNRCGFDELAKAGGARLVDADADAIAEVTVALMDDADLRAAMGRKGRDLVLQEYTWSIAAERHVAICRQILKGRGA